MPFGLIEDTVDKIQGVFAQYPQVTEAILYGSRAKGTHRNGSDIDLTLKGEGLDLTLINRISNAMDDLLLPYTLDLSIFSQIANPDLIEHIHRVGVVFYSA
ncbi:MAG: nucleotidyltransferase domain-containing protein [Planctomycetes bacterium]|nr:nucleotidyltransferase domain-containing protein [Planctomycetota bacterium]